MKKAVLILGAGSEIARAAAAAWARRGYAIFLAGRDVEDLARSAADLRVRYGVTTDHAVFDAQAEDSGRIITDAVQKIGALSGVLIAFGDNGDQRRAETDDAEALRIMDVNFVRAALMAAAAARYFQPLKTGFIVGISSVAGDRGRQSNYVYGASKGGLSLFLQGLRNRLAREGVHVMTVKPGFVDTAMTFGKPRLFAVAAPAAVGEAIVKAAERRRDVVYVPGFWRSIMTVIGFIPERVFKKLSL